MARHHGPRQILDIYSHGSKLPPLDPPADIAFDVSKVPNPPAHLRYSHDGRHKRLRTWLLEDPAFVNLLYSAERSIRQAAYEKRDANRHHHSHPGSRHHSRERRSLTPEHAARGATFEGRREGGAVSRREPSHGIRSAPHSRDNSPMKYDRETGLPPHRILRISSFCVAGHHRSVAFAEELRKLKWSEGWEVRVHHRDLGRDVAWYERHRRDYDLQRQHRADEYLERQPEQQRPRSGEYYKRDEDFGMQSQQIPDSRRPRSGEYYRQDNGFGMQPQQISDPRRPRSGEYHRRNENEVYEQPRSRPPRESKKSEGSAVAERVLAYLRP